MLIPLPSRNHMLIAGGAAAALALDVIEAPLAIAIGTAPIAYRVLRGAGASGDHSATTKTSAPRRRRTATTDEVKRAKGSRVRRTTRTHPSA